jgi:hypothetical protein
MARAEKEKLTAASNSKCIPSNATIREEYVKCGKSGCTQSKHGPYYYAYWKDNKGELRKYIGKYPPNMKKESRKISLFTSQTIIQSSSYIR